MSVKNSTRRLTVEALRQMPEGAELRDHVLAGLSVRRKQTATTWWLYYRDARGDRRRHKLGTYPALGLEPARDAGRAVLRSVALGADPSGDRRTAREALTVADAADRFMADHVRGVLAANTVDAYGRLLANVVKPSMGSRRMCDVTTADIEACLRRAAGPTTAARTRAVLRRMWRLAAAKGWTPGGNPDVVRGSEPVRTPAARERVAKPDEMAKLVSALEACRAEYPERVALILCLMTTGARVSELCGATTRDLHVAADGTACLIIADHKTARKTGKPRTIDLPEQALAEIGRLPNRARLFGDVNRFDVTVVWDKARAAAGVRDVRLHDLRRTFASHALNSGVTLHNTGVLLGHRSAQTTAGYAYLFADTRAAAAQAAADSVSRKR